MLSAADELDIYRTRWLVSEVEMRLAREANSLAQDALCDAAQFIDAVRQDAIREGWWTDWDQAMRGKITAALQAINKNPSTGGK